MLTGFPPLPVKTTRRQPLSSPITSSSSPAPRGVPRVFWGGERGEDGNNHAEIAARSSKSLAANLHLWTWPSKQQVSSPSFS